MPIHIFLCNWHKIQGVIDSRKKERKVYLTGMSQHFRRIFGMVGLTRYAEIVESVDEIQTQ